MLEISGNNISLTRGDSAYITISVKRQNGEPYELRSGDIIQCQVRTSVNTGRVLIDASTENGKIVIAEGSIVWRISADETKQMSVGKYHYDVQLKNNQEDVYTFIPDSIFNITNEVTRNERQ